MRKKAKAEIEAKDLEAAIALCDKLVEDFEDAIPNPLYCHYMDLALERALQRRNGGTEEPFNLLFVTRSDGGLGTLDLLEDSAAWWYQAQKEKGIALIVVDAWWFCDLLSGNRTVQDFLDDECDSNREDVKQPFVLSIWPPLGRKNKRGSIEKVLALFKEELLDNETFCLRKRAALTKSEEG